MRARLICLSMLAFAVAVLSGCVVPQDLRGEQTVCPVHDVKLKSETRQIVYGLRAPRDEYHRAAEKLFPYAESTVTGGCIQSTFSPVFA